MDKDEDQKLPSESTKSSSTNELGSSATPPPTKKPLVPLAIYLGKTKVWWPGISDEELDRRVHQSHEERERGSALAKTEEGAADKKPK